MAATILSFAVGVGGDSDTDEWRPVLDDARLRQLETEAPQPVGLSLTATSVGKGAAGEGILLAIEVARGIADIAGLVALGAYVLKLARVIQERLGGNEVTIQDPATLGAVASTLLVGEAGCAEVLDCTFVGSFPVTTDGSSGTDARDIWGVSFAGEGFGLVAFLSPTGRLLDVARVEAEWGPTADGDWGPRAPLFGPRTIVGPKRPDLPGAGDWVTRYWARWREETRDLRTELFWFLGAGGLLVTFVGAVAADDPSRTSWLYWAAVVIFAAMVGVDWLFARGVRQVTKAVGSYSWRDREGQPISEPTDGRRSGRIVALSSMDHRGPGTIGRHRWAELMHVLFVAEVALLIAFSATSLN